MRPIKEGDIINVYWEQNGEELLDVEVLHMPVATGDLLYVKGTSESLQYHSGQDAEYVWGIGTNNITIRKETKGGT